MKLQTVAINVSFAFIAGSLSAVGFAGQRAIASKEAHDSSIASDGADRDDANRVGSLSLYDTRYSLESSPHIYGPCR